MREDPATIAPGIRLLAVEDNSPLSEFTDRHLSVDVPRQERGTCLRRGWMREELAQESLHHIHIDVSPHERSRDIRALWRPEISDEALRERQVRSDG